MYILRSATHDDLESLYHLSSLMTFINLPNNKIELEEMLTESEKSFKKPSPKKEDNLYIFVIENIKNREILGASVIHARHGYPEEPHYYLSVSSEHKYCDSLNTGFIHGTLKLGINTDGYTEIGGLVLHPEARANGLKLGKQISFVRFLFMADNLDIFCEQTHSELMPPFDQNGKSPLWEAVGRRFINMDYYDADKLSRKNPDFILSLFPASNIYQTLLPVEAREAVGKVGSDTLPVKKMLEKIGFKYTNEVDPFDGGPHYRCPTKDIFPIKGFKKAPLKLSSFDAKNTMECLVSIPTKHHFSAVKAFVTLTSTHIGVDPELAKAWDLADDMTLSVIPFNA